jgi:hypothetical protein
LLATLLSMSGVENWLRAQGVEDVARVLDGVDTRPGCPMYLRWLQVGEKLVQYRDRPSSAFPDGAIGGRWFALASLNPSDMGRLAIGSGLAGRNRVEFTVARPREVLETTAKPVKGRPSDRYVGEGGATQVFIPDEGISSLR